MSTNNLLVSVCMITYNQAGYVQQALKNILDQVCDFEFEVIVSNDSSSDESDKLILELIKEHSNGHRVRYFYQPTNLGMNSNFQFVYNKCLGKYIAICEGDDYWTDSYKLQKQVDFLEANPEFVICYHPVNVLFPNGIVEEDYLIKDLIMKSESTAYDLAVLGNYLHTPSVVFRNVLKKFPELIKESPIGDFFLWMLLVQYGKIKKLPEVMAVYRVGVGIHSSQSEKSRQTAFLKTLLLLTEVIEDKTIVEILKNRMAAIKSASLPYPVRVLDDYRDLVKAEYLKDYISLSQLFKAVWLKIIRRF